MNLLPARIIAVNTADRLVDVEWLAQEGKKQNIVVVSGHTNLSMPKVGDTGVVLTAGAFNYYIGRVDFGYATKVRGKETIQGTEVKYREDDKIVKYREVKEGEGFFTNILKRTSLFLGNSGNMTLFNAKSEGLQYLLNLRMTSLFGQTVRMLTTGSGVLLSLGNAIRNNEVISGSTDGRALEFLAQIAYKGIQSVRFHMGEVRDTTTGDIVEQSSFGKALKVLLETTDGINPLAKLAMDEDGNFEIHCEGKVSIKGADECFIELGGASLKLTGNGSDTKLVIGTGNVSVAIAEHLRTLYNQLKTNCDLADTHVHPSGMGATGAPTITISAPSWDDNIVSDNVKFNE